MNIVVEMFRRLENLGIRYAVIRNYENLPNLQVPGRESNTDIDLVVDSAHVASFRELAKSLTEDAGWDAVTECDHFRQSPAPHHRIDTFRFYRLSPPECMQVDLFHGYVIQGLPFMTEEQMLAGRRYSPAQNITHIDPVKENTYRLVQIYALWNAEGRSAKLERYSNQLEEANRRNPVDFLRTVRQLFGRWGIRSIEALRKSDMRRFARMMSLVEASFCARYVFAHPSKALLYLAARKRESRLRSLTRPCGFVVRVHAPGPHEQACLVQAMDRLATLKVFQKWSARNSGGRLTAKERYVMERGGPIVEWTEADSADLALSAEETADGIIRRVMVRMINRHRTL
jgi:hypothetical protein